MEFFCGDSLGVGGFITRPLQDTLVSQVAAVLPISGGHSSSSLENFRFRGVVSFRRAHSAVSGSFDECHNRYTACAYSVVEGLNIADMVTADRVVSRVAVYSPEVGLDGEHSFDITGSHFDNLRIAGHLIDVKLATRVFHDHDTYSKIARAHHARKMDDWLSGIKLGSLSIGELAQLEDAYHALGGISEMVRQWKRVGDRPKYRGNYLFSPANHLKLEDHAESNTEIRAFGAIILVPKFGVVRLADLLIHESSRQLIMLRVEMCSTMEGSLAMGSARVGGDLISAASDRDGNIYGYSPAERTPKSEITDREDESGGETSEPQSLRQAPPHPRRLQVRFVEHRRGRKRVAAHVLAAGTAYRIEVRIARPGLTWTTLGEPFPEHLLPADRVGYLLQIVFVELGSRNITEVAIPQTSSLWLPREGDSGSCEFFVQPQKDMSTFRARVIVLYENRVLQTALVQADVVKRGMRAGKDSITLIRETVAHAGFEAIPEKAGFAAALVLNHADDGVPGVTAIAGNTVAVLEPEGLRQSLDNIGKIISVLTSLPERPLQLGDPDLVNLLRQLANHGHLTWGLFAPRLGTVLGKAQRIQVVEAREGALLPVEFFYEGRSPQNDAGLCGHAAAALAAAPISGECPNIGDPKLTCPTDFWGFSRVIERRPHMDIPYGKEYELSEPLTHRNKLDILNCAVFAASKRVEPTDQEKIIAELRGATSNTVPAASSWDALATAVEETSPSLIVLLPHSLTDPGTPGMAALELGGSIRNISQLDKTYVCGPKRDPVNPACKPGPAVLLLGCSTELTRYPFQTFVRGFQANGASLVLGTLSNIRGRHTVNFIRELLSELGGCCGQQEQTFGDVLLRVKRRLLAGGDPFALTLTAYGNAGWLV